MEGFGAEGKIIGTDGKKAEASRESPEVGRV